MGISRNEWQPSMTRLDGMLDIGEVIGRFIVHELGDRRRRRGCLCLLSNFGRRSLICVSLSRGFGLRLCAGFREFPIPDVLNLDLEGL